MTIDSGSPEFVEAVTTLARTLGLPLHDDVTITLQAIGNALQHLNSTRPAAAREGPAGAGSGKGSRGKTGGGSKPSGVQSGAGARGGGSGVDVSDFPLGFATGDPLLDRAATVLRLLYVADLRSVQTSVNEVIVQLQEFTADPKTDSRLGRVGM